MIEEINNIPGAPAAIGPYSQAAVAGGLIFISGQIPLNPETGELATGIENQTEQVLKNLKAVLAHFNINFRNVAKTTIFLTDLANFQVVNSIYERHMSGAKPARATVQVSALPKGAEIEIEMIAAK